MNKIFFILSVASLLIGCSAAIAPARKTEAGSKIEVGIENTAEALIEAGSRVIGTPIDVEIDFDPAGNAHPKCKDCSIHCNLEPHQKLVVNVDQPTPAVVAK